MSGIILEPRVATAASQVVEGKFSTETSSMSVESSFPLPGGSPSLSHTLPLALLWFTIRVSRHAQSLCGLGGDPPEHFAQFRHHEVTFAA